MLSLFKLADKKQFLLSKGYDPKIVDWAVNLNETYSVWLANLAKNKKVIIGEDDNFLKETLADFDKVKKLPQFTRRDINSYKTYGELVQTIEPFLSKQTKRQESASNFQKGAKLISSEIIDNKKVDIYELTTEEAAAHYCRGVKWCIKDPEYFRSYRMGIDNPAYAFYVDGQKYSLLNERSGQFKDIYNDTLEVNEFNRELYNLAKKLNIIIDSPKAFSKLEDNAGEDLDGFLWDSLNDEQKYKTIIESINDESIFLPNVARNWITHKLYEDRTKNVVPEEFKNVVYNYICEHRSHLPSTHPYLNEWMTFQLYKKEDEVPQQVKYSIMKYLGAQVYDIPSYAQKWVLDQLFSNNVSDELIEKIKSLYKHHLDIGYNGVPSLEYQIKSRPIPDKLRQMFYDIISETGYCPEGMFDWAREKLENGTAPQEWKEAIFKRMMKYRTIQRFAINWFKEVVESGNMPQKWIDKIKAMFKEYGFGMLPQFLITYYANHPEVFENKSPVMAKNWYTKIKLARSPLPEIEGLPEYKKLKTFEGRGISEVDRKMKEETAKELDREHVNKKYLGHGFYGLAFEVPGEKVVKITTEIDEYLGALALMNLQNSYGGNLKGVVKILDAKELPNDTYKIVLQKVIPLNSKEIVIFDKISESECRDISCLHEEFLNNVVSISKSSEIEVKEVADKYLELIKNLKKEGLTFRDFWGRNIGKDKNNNYVVLDLGVLS